MITRYLLSLILGTVMTFILFSIMIALIHIGRLPVTSDTQFNMVDFIRHDRNRDLNLDETKPLPPPAPTAPPAPAQLQMESFATAPVSPNPLPSMNFDAGLAFTGGEGIAMNIAVGAGGGGSMSGSGSGIGMGGGDYLPIAQIAPPYPRNALVQGIEGWVQVEFTIGTEGQVKNPRVVRSAPPGVFEEAALGAVKRFRFRPRTVGSTPVEVHGVQNRIRFRLER